MEGIDKTLLLHAFILIIFAFIEGISYFTTVLIM